MNESCVLENIEVKKDISWEEINQQECEYASLRNMCCWKEFD